MPYNRHNQDTRQIKNLAGNQGIEKNYARIQSGNFEKSPAESYENNSIRSKRLKGITKKHVRQNHQESSREKN